MGEKKVSTDCVLSLLRAANAEVTYKKRLRLTLLHAADGRAQPLLLLLCRRDIQAAPAVGTTGESGGIWSQHSFSQQLKMRFKKEKHWQAAFAATFETWLLRHSGSHSSDSCCINDITIHTTFFYWWVLTEDTWNCIVGESYAVTFVRYQRTIWRN